MIRRPTQLLDSFSRRANRLILQRSRVRRLRAATWTRALLFLGLTAGGLAAPRAVAEAGVNARPEVSIVAVQIDENAHQVVVTYHLHDAENDTCAVTVNLSADGGATYRVAPAIVTGNHGPGIAPGTNKQVIWHYDPAVVDLSAEAPADYHIRLVADDGVPVAIDALLAEVSAARMQTDLEAIVGIRHATANPAHLEFTRNFIRQRLLAHGAALREHPFTTGRNLIGRFPGFAEETTTYVLDAHYDTVATSPGADDNGSGVVGMLEAMRLLSGLPSRRTLEFIAFDREELGLAGSTAYVQQGIPSYVQIAGVFNFEMIGYYSEQPNSQSVPDGFNTIFPDYYSALSSQQFKGNFLAGATNVQSNPLRLALEQNAATHVPGLRVLSLLIPPEMESLPDMRRSDHASFWSADIPSFLISDGGNFRNPHYHTLNDTVSTLNFGFMSNVVRATLATLVELAEVRHAGWARSEIVLPPRVVVPSVVNLELSQAAATLTDSGLTPASTAAFSATVPVDVVISQDPAAGAQVFAGSTVSLVVSLGAEPVPPTVTLTAPTTLVHEAPVSLTLVAAASGVDDNVVQVEFLQDGQSLGTDSTEPYLAASGVLGPGVYAFTACATDTQSLSTVSEALSITVVADRDGDGLPGAWELEHGLDPGDPEDGALDEDHDGRTNRDEYVFGTNPQDAMSHTILLSFEPDGNGGYTLTFATIPDRIYTIHRSPDLQTWTPLPEAQGIVGTGDVLTHTDHPGEGPRFFYRIEATAPDL